MTRNEPVSTIPQRERNEPQQTGDQPPNAPQSPQNPHNGSRLTISTLRGPQDQGMQVFDLVGTQQPTGGRSLQRGKHQPPLGVTPQQKIDPNIAEATDTVIEHDGGRFLLRTGGRGQRAGQRGTGRLHWDVTDFVIRELTRGRWANREVAVPRQFNR